MEMHQIRYFLAVARTLNFTRAAEESNVTQPSLTRAIQKLEDEFGGLLFRRERSLTHLTDMGRQMLPHLERTYAAAMAAKELAKGIGKASVSPLNLGIASTLDLPRFSEALAEVGAGLPGLQLNIAGGDAETLFQDLLRGDLDMALAPEPRLLHDRLDTQLLYMIRYGVAAPDGHGLFDLPSPSIAALRGVAWIGHPGDLDAEFRDACAAAGAEPDDRHTVSSTAAALPLVAARLGCTLVAEDAVLPLGVARLALEGLALQRRVVLATVAGRQRPPAGEALLRSVRARAWP